MCRLEFNCNGFLIKEKKNHIVLVRDQNKRLNIVITTKKITAIITRIIH